MRRVPVDREMVRRAKSRGATTRIELRARRETLSYGPPLRLPVVERAGHIVAVEHLATRSLRPRHDPTWPGDHDGSCDITLINDAGADGSMSGRNVQPRLS